TRFAGSPSSTRIALPISATVGEGGAWTVSDVMGRTLQLLGNEFQNLGGLAIDIRGRSGLSVRLRLDGARHRLIEEGADRLVAGQHAPFYESPKECNRGAHGRHRICRVVK